MTMEKWFNPFFLNLKTVNDCETELHVSWKNA